MRPLTCLARSIASATILLLAPQVEIRAQAASPCTDSTYTALKRRSVDSLSVREYEMFRERDRACINSLGKDSATARAPDSFTSFSAGQTDGREAANRQGTAGWFAGGFVGGLFLGLIGTGVVYAVAAGSESGVSATELTALATKPAPYTQAFSEAYRMRLGAKKKSSALVGGVLGTATTLTGE